MLNRFLHNKTAVGTVSLVLIVALMGIFAPFIAPTILTPPTSLINSLTSVKNIPLAPTTSDAVSFPA